MVKKQRKDNLKGFCKGVGQLKNLSFKASLKNYSATLLGLFLWFVIVCSFFRFCCDNAETLGVLYPVVVIIIILLSIKLMKIIPRPISTYEVIEVR